MTEGRIALRQLLPALVLLLVAASCDEKEKAGAETGEDFAIERTAERGPVAFHVRVDRKEITIAERLELVLEVDAEEGWKVELPAFGEKLEQFMIEDYRTPVPELLANGRVRTRKEYTLEPFLSGDYTLPAMTVTFKKPGEEKPHELTTEPFTVKVTSLLPKDAKDLAIRDIAPPVSLPAPDRRWLYAAGGGALLAILLAAWLWRRRGTGDGPPEARRLPAHEIAYRELEALLARNLVEKGEVKLFYLGLSSILRHYIERRFDLHAPERTTEEFLEEMRAADALSPSHKDLLKAFLVHCDLVKFAEHTPGNDEIRAAFDACKRFIEETKRIGEAA